MRKMHIKAQVAIGIVCAVLTFAIATQLTSVRKNVATESKAQRTEELQQARKRKKRRTRFIFTALQRTE